MLKTLYAHKLFHKNGFDVVITKEPELTKMPPNQGIMLFQFWQRSRPDKRNKYIMYNCFKYRLEWTN